MISPETVASELPGILKREGEYGDSKYVGNNPQRQVPDRGLSPDSPAYIEFFNYLQRVNAYVGEGDEFALQLSQAYVKFLNTGRTLVRAFEERELDAPDAAVADARAMTWIEREVLYPLSGHVWGEQHELCIGERLSDIDRLVREAAPAEARSAARELFVAQAQFCVAGIARAGVLPAAGDSTDGAFEYVPPRGLQQTLFIQRTIHI